VSVDFSWAERSTWTPDDQSQFYAKLKRARRINRASYLIRQAEALAKSRWPDGNAIALALLDEATTHGVEAFHRSAFHKLRAECLFRRGDAEAAAAAYDAAFDAQAALPNIRVGLEIAFAWEVATRRIEALYDKAVERLAPVAKESMTLAWPINQYRYFGALAIISDELGDREGARRWATNALAASERVEGPFPRHRSLGVVETPESRTHNDLLRLAAV
jgi:tetratricopeptide (TPR) repeat protein